MSFIYENNNLLKALLNAGESSLNKEAQAQNPVFVPIYEVALKLLQKMQRDLGDPNAPAASMPVGVEGGTMETNLSATTANLRTLGDFLNWAADNKITWSGERVAWSPEERNSNQGNLNHPSQKAWMFTSLPFDRNDRSMDRQPFETTVYADKDVLTKYLSALRDSPQAKENNVLQFMLAAIIGQMNSYLKVQNKPTIETRPSTQVQLKPDLVVDVIPYGLSKNNLMEGLDNFPFTGASPNNLHSVTVNDLKDETSFLSWFKDLKVKSIVDGKELIQSPLSFKGDPCLAVHCLYKRAQYLKSRAKVAGNEYVKAVELYFTAITAYGSQIADKNGNLCAVVHEGTGGGSGGGGSGSAGGGKGGESSSGGTAGGTGKAVSNADAVKNLVRYMPLTLQSVDFNRIDSFFVQYENMLGNTDSSQKAQVEEAHALFTSKWTDIDSILSLKKSNFPLIGGADTVIQWLKNPLKDYSSFVQILSEILQVTHSTISLFYDSYVYAVRSDERANAVFDSSEKSIVKGQTTIYQSNMRTVNNWKAQIGKVQGFKNSKVYK